jgi:hypothetical protein
MELASRHLSGTQNFDVAARRPGNLYILSNGVSDKQLLTLEPCNRVTCSQNMREVEQIYWNFKVSSHLSVAQNVAASGVTELKMGLGAYKRERRAEGALETT